MISGRLHLIEHVPQDKYRYDHHWKDGDVVIAEQWLTIHKRHTFERTDKRILHRLYLIMKSFSKINIFGFLYL